MMGDVEEEPLSLPCSAPEAKAGLPTIVQLYLVNEGLEKSPLPREDFYRQWTPTPPPYTYEEELQTNKEFAASVAKSLKQFYAGRVLLRREEAEQHGDLEQDPNYWESKADQWLEMGTDLYSELRKRQRKERKGLVEKGFARAMLLSPVQSPFLAPLDRGLLEATQQSKPSPAISDGSPELRMHLLQPGASSSHELVQSAPANNGDDPPTLRRGRKRTYCEVEGQQRKSPGNTRRKKRQRMGMTKEEEPMSATNGTYGWGQTMAPVPTIIADDVSERICLSEFSSPSDGLGTNGQNPSIVRLPKKPIGKTRSESHKMSPLLQQPTPDDSSDSNRKMTKYQKSSHVALKGRENERRASNRVYPRKGQRRDASQPLPLQKVKSVAKLGKGSGKKSWKVAKASTVRAGKPEKIQAPRVLPWILRPRDTISYCEVGTRAA